MSATHIRTQILRRSGLHGLVVANVDHFKDVSVAQPIDADTDSGVSLRVIGAPRRCADGSGEIVVVGPLDAVKPNDGLHFRVVAERETSQVQWYPAVFFCRLGETPLAAPAGRLLQALAFDLWKDDPHSRPRFYIGEIKRKTFTLMVRDRPLTAEEYAKIDAAARAYDTEPTA